MEQPVSMSAKNVNKNSALVPRPPSAVEKFEPGAKRVLALMVSDTLAIAQRHLAPAVRNAANGDHQRPRIAGAIERKHRLRALPDKQAEAGRAGQIRGRAGQVA